MYYMPANFRPMLSITPLLTFVNLSTRIGRRYRETLFACTPQCATINKITQSRDMRSISNGVLPSRIVQRKLTPVARGEWFRPFMAAIQKVVVAVLELLPTDLQPKDTGIYRRTPHFQARLLRLKCRPAERLPDLESKAI